MKPLIIFFLLSLLLGQFGGIQIIPGVTLFIHDVLLSCCLLVFCFQHLRQKKKIKGDLIKPLAYFICAAIVSLLLNVGHFSNTQLLFGSLYLWRFILYGGLYFIVRNEQLSSFFWYAWIYLIGVGFAILGIVQYIFFPSLRPLIHLGWDEHYYRLFSTLLDPNFSGLFLVLSFLLGLSLYSKKIKYSILIGQSLLGVAIVLTYSRSTFLAFCIGLFVFVMRTKKIKLLFTILVGVLLYAMLPTHGVDTNRLLRSDSAFARLESYSTSFAAARIAPIFGIGYNMLRFYTGREKMLDVNGVVSRDAAGLNSSLMVIFVTTGIIGFSLFMHLLYRIVAIMYRHRQTGSLSISGMSAFAAIVTHSLFNNSLFYSWILIWLWIIVGSIEKEPLKE